MKLAVFLSIVEIRTKIVSVSTLILAILYTLWKNNTVQLVDLGLLVPAALAIDMGTTAFNSFFDYLGKVDNKKFNREADKVLVHNKIPPAWALLTALGLFAFAGILGLILTLLNGWWLLPAGLACMAVGFLYTGGPLPISRTPLGEVFAGGTLGMAFFVIACKILGLEPSADMYAFGLPSTLCIASILAVNNASDRLGDTEAGRKTLAIICGPKGASLVAYGLMLGGYILGIVLTIQSAKDSFTTILLGILWFLAAIFAFFDIRGLAKNSFSHEFKGPNMGRISSFFLNFTLTMALAFLALRGFPH